MNFVLIYITNPSKQEARKIAKSLLIKNPVHPNKKYFNWLKSVVK